MVVYFVLDLTSNESFALNQIDDYETGCSSSSSTVSNKKNRCKDQKSDNTDGTIYIFLLLYFYLFIYIFKDRSFK